MVMAGEDHLTHHWANPEGILGSNGTIKPDKMVSHSSTLVAAPPVFMTRTQLGSSNNRAVAVGMQWVCT